MQTKTANLDDAIESSATELEQLAATEASRIHPDPAEVRAVVDQARQVLFPEFAGLPSLTVALREWAERLVHLAATEHHGACNSSSSASMCGPSSEWGQQIAKEIVTALPELRRILNVDLRAALDADPAAQGPVEIFLCYPGFHAIVSHRIAHVLWNRGARLIARLVSEHAHTRSGIDIHPGAQIDAGFFIDHGTGVVVGETANIGKFVRLYQGVTLGALSLRKDRVPRMHGVKRHPTLEDEVIVYANATILGGNTVVGKGAVIGGNSWITKSIAPGTIVTTQDIQEP